MNPSDISSLHCPHCKSTELINQIGDDRVICGSCGKSSTLDEVMAATVNLKPMTDVQIGTAQMFEMYEGHVGAGFTERQALYIIMALATGNPGQAPRPA